MKRLLPFCAVLVLAASSCRKDDDTTMDASSRAAGGGRAVADSPAAATPVASEPKTDTSLREKRGAEPGTFPATPTPTVTTESSINAMRAHLQQLDSASAQALQSHVADHQKMLGDLLTTMRVEAQGSSSARKNAWLAAADSVEGDLHRLAMARGEELRTAFRTHRTRVLKLLDDFRAIVPRTV